MADPSDLHTQAVDLLAAAVEALDTIPVFEPGFVGAPARRFVSPGKPAYDCCLDGQLTVHIQPGPTERFGEKGGHVTDAVFNVTSLRCITTEAEAPVPADAQAIAAQLNRDAWALWNHIYNLTEAGDLFQTCCGVIWGRMTSLEAQGTCGGWLWPITVCVDGYSEVFGT